MAAENGQTLGLSDRVTWLESDLFTEVPPMACDWLVSNPPYLTAQDMADLQLKCAMIRNLPYTAVTMGFLFTGDWLRPRRPMSKAAATVPSKSGPAKPRMSSTFSAGPVPMTMNRPLKIMAALTESCYLQEKSNRS